MSFSRYNQEDIVVSSETVVQPAWSNNQKDLTSFYVSNTFSSSYYTPVYNQDPSIFSSASVQFSIEYGHVSGSGSLPINSNAPVNTPTRIVYGQYRNLIYGSEENTFVFNNVISENFFVINVNRSRYKQSLKEGSFNITLTSGSNTLYLTDNSGDVSTTSYIDANRYYTIVSGSNGKQSDGAIINPSGSYGIFLPDMGIILFNARALSVSPTNGGISLVTGSANNNGMFQKIINSGANFSLQSSETVSSTFFFTRVKNLEWNYTTNPSIIDNQGNILFSTLINNPQTYVTTVGLYNENNELLAVAKLSRPLVKDFTKELSLRIKLSY